MFPFLISPLWTVYGGISSPFIHTVVTLSVYGPRRTMLRDSPCIVVKTPKGRFSRSGLRLEVLCRSFGFHSL